WLQGGPEVRFGEIGIWAFEGLYCGELLTMHDTTCWLAQSGPSRLKGYDPWRPKGPPENHCSLKSELFVNHFFQINARARGAGYDHRNV
ncbi:MAG: hypothetical protein RSC66_14195, partial [Comamonas sp.]